MPGINNEFELVGAVFEVLKATYKVQMLLLNNVCRITTRYLRLLPAGTVIVRLSPVADQLPDIPV